MIKKKRGGWTERDDAIVIGECLLSLYETGNPMPGAREAAKILDRYITHCEQHFQYLCRHDRAVKSQAKQARADWRNKRSEASRQLDEA